MALLLLVFLVWTPAAYAWSWPVQGPILQPFSYDEAHPYTAGQHRGVDIGADAVGEGVVAPAAGTVSFAGTVPTNGKTVTIETADGYSVTLTHLGSLAVPRGATVAEQDPVGTIGPSGTPEVDEPYVHLGIRVTTDPNGYVDPLDLLPPAPGDAATETSTTASQPVSSGASAAAPASKPAPSAPRRPRVARARGTRAEPARSQVRVHHQQRARKPRADNEKTRVQQRPAIRDRASEPTTSSVRRPIVESVAPRPVGLDARPETRPGAYVAPPRPKLSSPLLAFVCNWAAALFALGAVFAARGRRSNTSPTVSAEVLRLPLPEDELRQVSRAA
ncbi:MAG TPA: M23 family metallopeptidase [Gaiellaceae bacterium]